MEQRKPYRICAFYDTETCNIASFSDISAYPVLHQLGVTHVKDLTTITPENVVEKVSITLYRHTFELYQALDELPGKFPDCVPVVCVHNLGFDMYSLSSWLLDKNVRVLAKSSAKPISFTILNEDNTPQMVIWDSLGFSMRGLAKMGVDCGYPKLTGDWDYNLIRTPETPLTDDEVNYAKHDIYVLACWFAWFLRRNPQVQQEKLGLNIVTKTGVVRDKRIVKFSQVKGKNASYNVGRFWYFQNRKELPKDDEELFTMHACTRGGLTFTSGKWASIPLDLHDGTCVAGFDATSQHPAMMVSKLYPEGFKPCKADRLNKLARIVSLKTVKNVLDHWAFPFPTAFNACFEFSNIRLKQGTLFERERIATLAFARFGSYTPVEHCDNESGELFKEWLAENGYRDRCSCAKHEFGKLVSADSAILFLTEVEYWIMCQVYEWDSCNALFGYATDNFVKPTDMCILSVMDFYQAKQVFKKAMNEYERTHTITNANELKKYVPDALVDAMQGGTATDIDIHSQYMLLKSDLNSLYGIECTNESRIDCSLTNAGIVYSGTPGISNLPKNPKAWYQFGQRIVAWSRVSQVIAMSLAYPYVEGIINGDTDSIKILVKESNINPIKKAFSKMADSINDAQRRVCGRVERQYPQFYTFMPNLGEYCLEFQTRQYCAAWNKAYCIRRDDGFNFTFAGITTNRAPKSYNDLANWLYESGWSFTAICNVMLGYNVTIDASITKQNARKVPEFGSTYHNRVVDYKGNRSRVVEPHALALYPLRKLVGGTTVKENADNLAIALENNRHVNANNIFIEWINKTPSIVDVLTGCDLIG